MFILRFVGWAKELQRRAHHLTFKSVGTLRFAHPTKIFTALNFLKRYQILILLFFSLFSTISFASNIMVLSLLSDAHYAVSTDDDGHVYLWDLQKQTDQKIADNANPFSAYFVKGTDYFMWQSQDNNIVTVQDPTGKVIKTFNPKIQSYGSILTRDLAHYIASDHDWNMYVMDINTNEINKEPGGGAVDLKPYTYDISEDQKNILGVGDSVVWVLGHGINWQSSKNVFKTVAVFSPDGKYVVSADEDSGVFVFQTKTGKKMFMVDDLVLGRWNPNISDSSKAFDKSVIIAPEPDDFGPNYAANRGVLSIKFIDATHYLTFIHRSDDSTPYAILYNVTDPRALKYFSLGQHPYPALNYYERDQAIDTSPSAHILVIAKESGEGILVYKYDPQKQTLTKVWEGNA